MSDIIVTPEFVTAMRDAGLAVVEMPGWRGRGETDADGTWK